MTEKQIQNILDKYDSLAEKHSFLLEELEWAVGKKSNQILNRIQKIEAKIEKVTTPVFFHYCDLIEKDVLEHFPELQIGNKVKLTYYTDNDDVKTETLYFERFWHFYIGDFNPHEPCIDTMVIFNPVLKSGKPGKKEITMNIMSVEKVEKI